MWARPLRGVTEEPHPHVHVIVPYSSGNAALDKGSGADHTTMSVAGVTFLAEAALSVSLQPPGALVSSRFQVNRKLSINTTCSHYREGTRCLTSHQHILYLSLSCWLVLVSLCHAGCTQPHPALSPGIYPGWVC